MERLKTGSVQVHLDFNVFVEGFPPGYSGDLSPGLTWRPVHNKGTLQKHSVRYMDHMAFAGRTDELDVSICTGLVMPVFPGLPFASAEYTRYRR